MTGFNVSDNAPAQILRMGLGIANHLLTKVNHNSMPTGIPYRFKLTLQRTRT
jgi:hypothetical protein